MCGYLSAVSIVQRVVWRIKCANLGVQSKCGELSVECSVYRVQYGEFSMES